MSARQEPTTPILSPQSMTTASPMPDQQIPSHAPAYMTRKLRAECQASTDNTFDAVQHLQNIFTIIFRTDPTASLVSKNPTYTFSSADEIPTDLQEFHRHFDVVYHKRRQQCSQFHIVFYINSVKSLQEWKSTTSFLLDLTKTAVWLHDHHFNTSDVRVIGIFTHISPTLTHRQKFRKQLMAILTQVQRENSSPSIINSTLVNPNTTSLPTINNSQTEDTSESSSTPDDAPIFEVLKTTICISSNTNPQEHQRTTVLAIRSEQTQAHRLCQLIQAADLDRPCFGTFMPTSVHTDDPQTYHNQLTHHHHHLQSLRQIVVYGLHEQVMNRPFPLRPSSSQESFYHHLTGMIDPNAPSEMAALFPHVAVTQQTETHGKWLFITHEANYSQARKYLEEDLPNDYMMLLTTADHNKWTKTFLRAPKCSRHLKNTFHRFPQSLPVPSPHPERPPTSLRSNPTQRLSTTSGDDNHELVTNESFSKPKSAEKTYASVVSRSDNEPSQLTHITTDIQQVQKILQEFTTQFRDLTKHMTDLLQSTNQLQDRLDKMQREFETQQSTIQKIQQQINNISHTHTSAPGMSHTQDSTSSNPSSPNNRLAWISTNNPTMGTTDLQQYHTR